MVIEITAPLFCILLALGSGIGWLLWKKRGWQIKYWLIPVFMCYCLLVLNLTVFPIRIFDKTDLDKYVANMGGSLVFYQLIPFASIKNYFSGSGPIQLIGNAALLSPLAVFAEVFLRQRPRAWQVALGVSAVSLLLEITQLIISLTTGYPSRVVDVDDLILNTAGAILALVFTRAISRNGKIRSLLQKILYR